MPRREELSGALVLSPASGYGEMSLARHLLEGDWNGVQRFAGEALARDMDQRVLEPNDPPDQRAGRGATRRRLSA